MALTTRRRGPRASSPPQLGPSFTLLTLIAFGLAPVLHLLADAWIGPGNVFPDARALALLARSLGIAVGASLLALLTGGATGLILARVQLRGASAILLLLFAGFCVSPYVQALGWLGGRLDAPFSAHLLGSPTGAAVVLAATQVPLVALLVFAAARELPTAPERAALLHAPPSVVLARILLPGLAVPLAAAGLVAFDLVFADYAVASLLQVPTYPVEIFLLYAGAFEPGAAARAALPLLLIGGLAAAGLAPLLARLVTPRPGGTRAATWPLPPGAAWVFRCLLALLLLAVLAPPFARLLLDLPPTLEAARALGEGRGPIANALTTAGLAALLSFALAWPASAALSQRSRRGIALLAIPLLLPLSIPGAAYGIGWVELASRLGLAILPGPLAPALCLAARFAGLCALLLAAARLRLPKAPLDAARIQEGRRLRRSLVVDTPPLVPVILACGTALFAFSLHAVAIHVLTAPPGFELLTVRVDNLLHYGLPGEARALALAAAALAAAPVAILVLAVSWIRRPQALR